MNIDWNMVVEIIVRLVTSLAPWAAVYMVWSKQQAERPTLAAQAVAAQSEAAKNEFEIMERLQKQQENENLGQRNILLRLQNELLEKQHTHEQEISAIKSDLQAKLTARDTERQAERERAETAESKITVLEDKTKALEEEQARALEEQTASSEKIKRLEKELAEAQAQLVMAQAERKEEREKTEARIKELEETVQTLNEKLETEREINQKLTHRLSGVEQVQTAAAEVLKDGSESKSETEAKP